MKNSGKTSSVLAGFLLVTLAVASISQTPTSHISGAVTDSEGAVIAKAVVIVHWDPSGSQVGLTDNIGIEEDLRATTNSDGEVTIDVPPGFYDVFVSSMSFSPRCLKVRVKANRPGEFKVRLPVDPVVSKELD